MNAPKIVTAIFVKMTTPPPSPPPPGPLVWFAPDMGSTDYPELFTQPEKWPVARSKINVFKFYSDNVTDAACAICGNNTLNTFVDVQAFRRLRAWKIAIGVEAEAVNRDWGCTGVREFETAQLLIQNVHANGGSVTYLAMDEPFIKGLPSKDPQASNQNCNYTMAETVERTAWFIKQVRAKHPAIAVGDIEPYPYFSISELEQWIAALEANGATPAFFHLDVDRDAVQVGGQDVAADLQALNRFCGSHGIPFGVVFWSAADSESAYYESTLNWVRTVNAAIGKPVHVIFQSWQGTDNDVHKVPINLPENDPAIYSHTRLLIDGLAVFGP
jgi:hypothetical protein